LSERCSARGSTLGATPHIEESRARAKRLGYDRPGSTGRCPTSRCSRRGARRARDLAGERQPFGRLIQPSRRGIALLHRDESSLAVPPLRKLELEEHWDPYKLHIDGTAEHRVGGATWLIIYQETKLPVGGAPETHEAHDRWTILSACESVTVPAGTFTAIYIQKVSATGGSAKTYWYVPGVGKVKESGGQLEELVSYSLVP